MKLISVSLLSVLFILSLADTKPCTGSRCKRMNVVSQLYNDYDYGYGEGYGGGYKQRRIEHSCGRQSPSYHDYGDDDGGFYSRENSPNSASSNDDDYYSHEDPKQEDNFGFPSAPLYNPYHQQLQQRPSHQSSSENYQRGVGPKTGQSYHPSNQQPSNPSTPHYDNQETEYTPNPDRNNEGKIKRGKQGGIGGHYQNNGAGSNGRYPGSGNQGGDGGRYQNVDAGYTGYYPDSVNQGGGEDHTQRNGGSYRRYPDSESSCPNCYATDFGNGDYNQNVINIEK